MTARILSLVAGFAASVLVQAQPAAVPASGGYPIDPVPFTSVKVSPDSFWGQRLKASREVTIPLAFSKCESEGRYENFVKAAKQMHSPVNLGYEVKGYSFDDTDVYKTIEGASYVLQTYPDKKLEAYIDSVLAIVAAAQEPDGYLYTARTMNPEHPHEWAGDKRWVMDEELSHELYNLGHMVEGAVAHWQATGKRNFLDIAIRYADCVVREVGSGSGQARVIPGHQIAEMALAKLYLATGDKKYLDEAKFFLDERGKTGHNDPYNQSHVPVLEQDEAVGHAVRAAYMYAGMADVAALTGDQGYIDAIDRIWENIVSKKLYITGGIGATNNGEAFGANYELPNMSAYCTARPAPPLAMSMSITGCSSCTATPSTTTCWSAPSITVSSAACPWKGTGSSIPTRWNPSASISARPGSAAPAAPPTSAVSSRPFRAMSMP